MYNNAKLTYGRRKGIYRTIWIICSKIAVIITLKEEKNGKMLEIPKGNILKS